jgi:hypothetical protein
MTNIHPILLIFALAHCADVCADGGKLHWYRYYNENNQPTVTDHITQDHIIHGYDELNRSMQFIKHVAPQKILSAKEMEAAKASYHTKIQQDKNDRRIRSLYNSVSDAEYARDRQLSGFDSRITFSQSNLKKGQDRLAQEMKIAAEQERKNGQAQESTKKNIQNQSKLIKIYQQQLNQLLEEKESIRKDFNTDIDRLKMILNTK